MNKVWTIIILITAILSSCRYFDEEAAVAQEPAFLENISTITPDSSPETSEIKPTDAEAIQLPQSSAQNLPPITLDNINFLSPSSQIIQENISDFVWLWTSDSVSPDYGLAFAQTSAVTLSGITSNSRSERIPAENPQQLTSAPQLSLSAWINENNSIQVWDMDQGIEILNIQKPADFSLTGLAISPDGTSLAISSTDNSLEIWSITTKETLSEWQFPFWMTGLSFSPQNEIIAAVDVQNFQVNFIDLITGVVNDSLQWTEHASPVLYSANLTLDWEKLAWVARGSVQLMNVMDGSLGELLSHEDFVAATSWTPDGKIIATAAAGTEGGQFQPVVYLWDATNAKLIHTLVQTAPTINLRFSPDGTKLAVLRSDSVLQVWSISE